MNIIDFIENANKWINTQLGRDKVKDYNLHITLVVDMQIHSVLP